MFRVVRRQCYALYQCATLDWLIDWLIFKYVTGQHRKNGISERKVDGNCLQPGTQAGRPEDNFLQLLFTFQLQPFLHPCSFVLLSHSLAGHMCRPLNTLSLQLQATVLGLLASVMATLLGWMAEGKMPLHHVVILCSASVSTAFMASLLQGKKYTASFRYPVF